MGDEVQSRYDRMLNENPRQILSVTFRVERQKYNRFRFVVDPSPWNIENPISYSGRDVRCFLYTLFAEYKCVRDLIREIEQPSEFTMETREFVLLRERYKSEKKNEFLFYTKEIIIGSTPLVVREPFLIGEIVSKADSAEKIVFFKNLENFLNEFMEASSEHREACAGALTNYVVSRPPSMNEITWLNSGVVNKNPRECFEPNTFVYPGADGSFPHKKCVKPREREHYELFERRWNYIRTYGYDDEFHDESLHDDDSEF